ncbi:capsule assembly Wzi family protein [Arsukibacterium sp. UBA3155]|uniref:capsule assembly Wzi family protein n=1 Tax=Arsukibacterium sp. UBA3155 TaxID=1946058 RepID=UPI0025C50DAB|nr:capsule assembly Wzi family protein [Arsukibacterium sp. UBA3155]|tara:strand:- start:137007 stop:138350 length:1344 start_codon:yes stop_codon:yes gene_type:complete
MRLSGYFLAVCFSSVALFSQAAPWVDTDDRYLRSSLKILADGGYLHSPINTYPLMWQPLLSDLANINTASMNDSQLFAYLRVVSAADFARQPTVKSFSVATSSDAIDSNGFGRHYQHKAEVNISTEFIGKNWAVGISKQFAADNHYDNGYQANSNWDGSYAAYTVGNWVLSAAQQQLWWGPGYDSSANFSNNGRPLKALQLSRLNSSEPLLTILEPLGAVNMQLVLAEQPGSALLRHAKVVAARVNIKPYSQLEFGISGSQLYTVNNVVPAQQQFSPVYQFPDSRITSFSIDSRYSINPNLAAYGELTQNNSALGWLAGSEYLIANSTVQAMLVAEYKSTADDMQQWQSLQHNNLFGQAATRWLAGLELHYRDGSSFYANLSQASYSENTALVAEIPLTKSSQLAAGYQTPFCDGLLTIDAQLNRDTRSEAEAEFTQGVGIRWERRW